jgi:hypothetical protein
MVLYKVLGVRKEMSNVRLEKKVEQKKKTIDALVLLNKLQYSSCRHICMLLHYLLRYLDCCRCCFAHL